MKEHFYPYVASFPRDISSILIVSRLGIVHAVNRRSSPFINICKFHPLYHLNVTTGNTCIFPRGTGNSMCHQ